MASHGPARRFGQGRPWVGQAGLKPGPSAEPYRQSPAWRFLLARGLWSAVACHRSCALEFAAATVAGMVGQRSGSPQSGRSARLVFSPAAFVVFTGVAKGHHGWLKHSKNARLKASLALQVRGAEGERQTCRSNSKAAASCRTPKQGPPVLGIVFNLTVNGI